jgi:hypothetical protein
MSNKINYNINQKEKEQKIINYYKKLGELTNNKKLEKTKPIKRTKKNINVLTSLDYEKKEESKKDSKESSKEDSKEEQKTEHKQTKKNSEFIICE